MSNIKRVDIRGTLPFDCHEHDNMVRFLGQFAAPSIGFHIRYPGQAPRKPSKYPGGFTTMYLFEISGEEAVSKGYLDLLLKAIVDCGGELSMVKVRDIEENYELRMEWQTPAVPVSSSS